MTLYIHSFKNILTCKYSVLNIIETYAPSTINFNIQSGINVQYSGQVHGDDSPEIAQTTATTLQQYDLLSSLSLLLLHVQTKIKGIKFTCPDQVIGLVQFSCFLHIAMGTNTRSYTTGQESGLISPVAHPGSFLYLLPEHSVKTNGTLVALDYVSAVAGTAYIQVFRPSCGNSSFKFCYKSYSCINVNESCNIQPSGNHWKHNCGAGTIYSFGRRKCIDTSTNNIVPDTVRQDWNQMDFQMFDFVSEFMFTVSSVGRNFYQVPDADMLTVDPGDILAITEGTARFALLESTGENYEFYYDVNADPNWALRGTYGYRLQVTPSVLTARHSVKAFFVKPIHLKIRHIYDFLHEAYLNVLVTAENNVTVPALTATQLVEVQVVIANLTIAQILPVATNDTTTIIIPAHAGSKPVYTYTFGDGEVMVTNSSTVTHIYRTAGVYLITVTAENAISSMTATCLLEIHISVTVSVKNTQFLLQCLLEIHISSAVSVRTTEVIIQDSIKDLIAVPALNATIFGEPTVINWNISQGTNVTYTLMMGDTIKYVLEYPFMSELNCIASRIQTLLATAAIAEDTTVAPTIQCTTVSTVNMTNEIESENGTINGTNGLNTTIGVNVTCEEATTTPAVVQTTTTLLPLSCNGTSADNLVSSQTFNFSIPVQIPITGFVINETEPIKFGTSRMVHMSVIDGTNIEHSLSLNDSVLLISHLSSVNKTGYGIIDTSNYVRNGKHTLVGTVKNLVTPLTTFFLEVWIDYPITNLVINIDHYFIPVGNIVTFEVEMYWCSRFNTLFNYTDGTEVEYYYSDLLEAPENFNKTHFFGYPGLFPVQISITNPVDFNLTTHDIYVQYAVKNVEIYNRLVLPWWCPDAYYGYQ
ncbi:hypothetical protein KUTeg_004357 [Tegillarca granosa]|uniref:PKD domain-containing protein n=1 Tax=Tegillarca granosa TaxID=220873 RepID=A0ABQ9FPQ5_TEGGR|nr:hypothetical protein KUTeg_004357 [Tegillarca granosa]